MPEWLFLHKATFVLWFGAMALHVLGHLADTARLAPRDWYRRTRREVRGAGIRQWAVVTTIVMGCCSAWCWSAGPACGRDEASRRVS